MQKTNRLLLSINAKRGCYDDIKEALMSDYKWLYMKITNLIMYLISYMIILSLFEQYIQLF